MPKEDRLNNDPESESFETPDSEFTRPSIHLHHLGEHAADKNLHFDAKGKTGDRRRLPPSFSYEATRAAAADS